MCHCISRIPEDMKMLPQTSVSQVSWNWNLCPQLSLCLMCHRLVKSWACYASKAEGGALVRMSIILTGSCKTKVGDCILGGTTRDLMSVHNHVCMKGHIHCWYCNLVRCRFILGRGSHRSLSGIRLGHDMVTTLAVAAPRLCQSSRMTDEKDGRLWFPQVC